jgi:hypothetical protein
MRSLRSLHENRACGPQNFLHLRQNEFCNTILQATDIVWPPPLVRFVPVTEVGDLSHHHPSSRRVPLVELPIQVGSIVDKNGQYSLAAALIS